ncbi:hypothetical protein CLOP_g9915 [Closterium sp. NIES-67]|nr:hypothetical protein CLOP_g9915 [Closterium sp. NIES-67]
MSFLQIPLFPALWAPSPSPIAEVLSNDHLLSLVLRSLTRDSFRYALVCKRWYAAARLSLAHLTIKFEIRSSVLLDTIRRFSSLTHVTLGQYKVQDAQGDALFQCLGATCPHLTHLTVNYQLHMRVTSTGLSSLFRGCPRLRDLRLLTLNSLPHLPSSITLLTDLRTLHLCPCPCRYPCCRYGVDRFEHLVSPPESLGALQKLQEIRVITGSPFQGLSDCISSLTNLRSLTFLNPSLTQLPEAVGYLPLLQTLEVEMENLRHIPDSFQQLTSLQFLSLRCRYLKRLPEHVVGAMTQLRTLSLCCTSLQGLPGSLCSLPLSSLSILSCHVATPSILASLPEDFGALEKLETLRLEHLPNLKCLPESVGDLPRLRSTSSKFQHKAQQPQPQCSSVQHKAQQPWGLASLTTLKLSYCPQISSLPEAISSLTALRSLTLDRMSGLTSLPESLGQLKSLQRLELEFMENLSGLPKSLEQLRSLECQVINGGEVTFPWWVEWLLIGVVKLLFHADGG